MPFIGYPHNFLQGLSDFWQRFFADADQLQSLYDGSAILMGQAYLDLLTNVLNVSLQDAPIFNKEYYRLVTIREDQVHFERGASISDDRWGFTLPDGLVKFISLDNRVIEPTASLQERIDYDLTATEVLFKADPTDPLQNGTPLNGFARRQVDVAVGGLFDDSTRLPATTWTSLGVKKGDVIRFLDVGPGAPPPQRKRADYTIALVRSNGLYTAETSPLPATASPVNYVILRQPFDFEVDFEPMVWAPPVVPGTPVPVGAVAQLVHSRVDQGSVRIDAKSTIDGADVIEGRDYTVDYESGRIIVLSAFAAPSANVVSYTWRQEVFPLLGPTPRFASTGRVVSVSTPALAITARVLQVSLWAPDALIDRGTLAANFGSLIGSTEVSSEAYRAFLRGIFQLYVLGPVLERIESALNVILGLPVVRDDGEILQSVNLANPVFNRATTLRPTTNSLATYDFPKFTPLQDEILDSFNWGKLVLSAFQPLTKAATVTDYVQDPNWWHYVTIPTELFPQDSDGTEPTPARRSVNPDLVRNMVPPPDGAKAGDPGLKAGADEYGNRPTVPGHPVFRHRLAFVLMDRYFKYHTFIVKFDVSVFTPSNVGVKFEHSADDLNRLIFSARPAHTFIFAQPSTAFIDTVIMDDTNGDQYQPQRYPGADPNAPEIYPAGAPLPSPAPSVILGLFLPSISVGGQKENVLFQDREMLVGDFDLRAGDYYHYELQTHAVDFTVAGTPIAIPGAPGAPRRGHFVEVYIATTILAKRLVENVDYTVNYANMTITRLTLWDALNPVTVKFIMLNVGNVVDAPPDQTVGDTVALVGGISPSLVRAAYDPTALDLFDNPWPVTNHRDMSLVERALTLKIT